MTELELMRSNLIGDCFNDFADGLITEEESERRQDRIEAASDAEIREMHKHRVRKNYPVV